MIRALSESLFFFTIPFIVYVAYLVLRLTNPFAVDRWTRRVVAPLALVGLVVTIAYLLFTGIDAPRYEGGYVPAHIENGQIVPGRMR